MCIRDRDFREWVDIYKKIIGWELKLDASSTTEMSEILTMQKTEANAAFSKFIERHYLDWVNEVGEPPIMSNSLMRRKVFPEIKAGQPTVMLLMDNLRFDQWKILEPIISELYRVEEEDFFYSICLLYTSPSPRDATLSRMPSSA